MIAKFNGRCEKCDTPYSAGDSVRWSNLKKRIYCVDCWGNKVPTAAVEGSERLASRVAEIQAERESHAPATECSHHGARGCVFPGPSYNRQPCLCGRPFPGAQESALVLNVKHTGAAASSLAAVIAAAVQEHLSLGPVPLDTDAIREMIREECATFAPAPTIIECRVPERLGVRIEGAHYLMPRLLRLMGAGVHVYLWGPAGTGKTTAALQAAHALRGPEGGEIDTLDPSTPKSAVMGYRNLDKSPAETAFTRCWENGRVYVADECDNAPAHVQTLFNSALANGHAPLAWGSVPRSDGFGFAGTGNTPGAPTPSFPDRRPMSAAFKDRLYFIYWPLDPAIESRAAGLTCPPAPVRAETTCTPAEWGMWVRTVRTWAEKSAPMLMVTPRATLLGLQALALGETPAEVAHGLVFRGADEALVSKVLAACPLPGSK